jgi:hypothetical protein
MIDASPGSLAVASEQVERPPAKRLRTMRPAVIKKPAAVINEAHPPAQWHITWWPGGVEPRQRLRPNARRTTVIFNDSRSLILALGIRIVRLISFPLSTGGIMFRCARCSGCSSPAKCRLFGCFLPANDRSAIELTKRRAFFAGAQWRRAGREPS